MEESFDNRRRIQVGLLISHLDEDFDNSVCEGAMIAAEQTDVNLVIFPGRYIDGVYADKIRTEFEYQYNTLFDLPCSNKFDVLLVLIGTIGSHLDKEKKSKFLERYKGTPVITITSELDGYPCITVDNKTGMEQVVRHLAEVHGCRKIGFVSGPITSDDAYERLQVYKDTLESCGIEYDENRVVYGNFSKYVTSEVNELLDRCDDLEAIVFANDQMAIAGYQVLESRGLRPGKDIYVTGFDDDPAAQNLSPHLTTVKADPAELGYNAVLEAVNFVNNGTVVNELIPSAMVCRNSCGCQGNPGLRSIAIANAEENPKEFAESLSSFLFNKYRTSEETAKLRDEFVQLILTVDEFANPENIQNTKLHEKILEMTYKMADEKFFSFVHSDNLYATIEYIHKLYSKKMKTHNQHLLLNQSFIQVYKIIAERNAAYCNAKLDDNYFMTWQTNSITRDMLVFESYDDESYFSVIDKLTRLHMTSSYLFSYEPAVIHRKTDTWTMPEQIYLKAYHNGSDAVQLSPEQQIIRPDELFSNPYLPKDRRYSLLVSPLFSNEEHYGILMCEIEHQYFHYIQSVTVQLCAALKIITLMKQQAVTQRQLQKSLIEIKENNQILSDLSRQDELTGCYNRRGFFEALRKKLSDDANSGAEAIMIFADLDSLKTINDRFGHEEGDFAIRSAADILKHAFGDDEIVGRIGGDEFVVCAFLNEPITIPALREHVENVTQEFNDKFAADKPYRVHTSVGVYPFICTDTVEIGELLSHADTLLYEQKKHKKSILKSDD
jgi:diguanylate cyclase (GGDEF)-like protein